MEQAADSVRSIRSPQSSVLAVAMAAMARPTLKVCLLCFPSSKRRCLAPGEALHRLRAWMSNALPCQAITRVFNAVGDHAKMMEVCRSECCKGTV